MYDNWFTSYIYKAEYIQIQLFCLAFLYNMECSIIVPAGCLHTLFLVVDKRNTPFGLKSIALFTLIACKFRRAFYMFWPFCLNVIQSLWTKCWDKFGIFASSLNWVHLHLRDTSNIFHTLFEKNNVSILFIKRSPQLVNIIVWNCNLLVV